MRFFKDISATAFILSMGLVGLHVLTMVIDYVKHATGIY